MNKLAHLTALRAASKVAFGVACLAGCQNAESADDGASDPAQTSEVKSGSATTAKKFSCEDLTNAAFPGEDVYPGKAVATTVPVKQCCADMLLEKGAGSPHRWACCANRASLAENDPRALDVNVACTPWGPPCPPAMRPRARLAA